MSVGCSSNLPSSSVLTGKELVFLEPISKVGERIVPPFFRQKAKAPEGADKLWIVTNDEAVDCVDGFLIKVDVTEQAPHPSSGRSGMDVYVNLYLQDGKDEALVQVVQSKLTTLGRDLINCLLSFDDTQKELSRTRNVGQVASSK